MNMDNQNQMFAQKPIFNKDYFKIGEAIKIIDNKTEFDALIQEIKNECISITTIEWDSPMCGCAKYESKCHNYFVDDIQNGKIKIIKYSDLINKNN